MEGSELYRVALDRGGSVLFISQHMVKTGKLKSVYQQFHLGKDRAWSRSLLTVFVREGNFLAPVYFLDIILNHLIKI